MQFANSPETFGVLISTKNIVLLRDKKPRSESFCERCWRVVNSLTGRSPTGERNRTNGKNWAIERNGKNGKNGKSDKIGSSEGEHPIC